MSQEEQFRQLKMAWPAGLPAGRSRARYRQNLAPLSTRVGRGEFITPPWRPKSRIPAGRFWAALRERPELTAGVSPSRGHGVARRAEVPSSQPGLRAHRAGVPCIGHALTRAGRSITEKPGLQALVMATDASRETSLTDVVVTEL